MRVGGRTPPYIRVPASATIRRSSEDRERGGRGRRPASNTQRHGYGHGLVVVEFCAGLEY
jgi:hypothetical protein